MLAPILVALAAVVVASAVIPLPASAATRLCRQLETELAGGISGKFSAARYDAAIERQREQMDVALGQKQDAGCDFAIVGRAVRQCARINATIDRMERNLVTLQRDRKRKSGGGLSRKERAQVLAALKANDCRGGASERREPEQIAIDPPPSGSATKRELRIMLDENGRSLSDEPLEPFAGSEDTVVPEDELYRTMCVRSCDGYFYPMSSASTVSDFERDQRNCETSCPGTEIRLFYGATDTNDPSQMVSTGDGAPYSTLPTAFRHQQTTAPRPPGCGCAVSKNFEVVAGRPPNGSSITSSDTILVPSPGENANSGEQSSIITIIPPAIAQPVQPPAEKRALTKAEGDDPIVPDSTDRRVRVVGPEFLPDPKAAIDLQAPVPLIVR